MQTHRHRTQEERSNATRLDLLNATIATLAEKGYAATTTSEVAKRAGVSRGAQLHHYPLKDDLIRAAIEHVFERLRKDFRHIVAKVVRAKGSDGQPLQALWHEFQEPIFYAWLELLVASRTDPRIREKMRELTEDLRGEIRDAFRNLESRALGPFDKVDLVPGFLFALLEGLGIQRIVEDGDSDEVLNILQITGKREPQPLPARPVGTPMPSVA